VVVHAKDQRLTAAGQVDRTLLALADPTRRRVIDLLRTEPRRASELAELLRMTRPAMSRHLRVLRKSGLVSESEPDHDARVRLYRLERRRLAELRAWLEEVEAYWGEQLDAFKAYAEKHGKVRKK
jgi:DNA-binding transcriptional ArsR family regulator